VGLLKNNSFMFLSQIISLIIILIGFIILMGWIFNISILITPSPDYRSTSLPSSICFILIGISIFLLQKERVNSLNKTITQILSLIVVLTSFFILLDYIIQFTIGISLIGTIVGFQNLLLFRMSIIAIFSFILTGTSILFIDNKISKHHFSQYLMILVFFMMYLIILGYIYQTQIYEAPNTTQPSFYSAITFILIIIGVLCLRPNKGIVELITSERIGGAFGYKILLSIVIIPVIIGGLRLLGELGGLYDLRFGAALMTFAITTLLFIITLESAISIDNMDIKRKRAEEKLKTAHDHLEKQVKERTTELEDAYKLLKTSENNFRTLTENSVDIIARYDTDFRIIYINKGIGSIGLSREELIGKTIDELGVKKDTVNLWFQSFEKALATAEIQIIEFSLPDVEGLKVFNSYIIPEITNGKIKSLLVVTRDITHRNQVENALKETILELKRSNNDLERFAYVSSHDLQEPLRTIASFTQLLERRYKGQLDDDADEFMDYIVEAAVRMKAQINALLEYSRVSTKGKEFELVDTTAILSKTIKSLSTSLRDSCAEITVDELPNVMGDSDQLQKVFQNLISNAIKFRKNEQSLKIHISAYKDKDEKEYVFSVQDNGIGIEKQYMERIFVIFQRLHTRNVYKGTGIGLAVVKRVIDGHGGRVWVESEFGVGSTFYFTIPIRSENKI